MLHSGQLQDPAAGAEMQSRQTREAERPAGLDSSGADLSLVNSYLQQLLPALHDGTNNTVGNLGLDRQSLLARGLPQHSINSLYRSLAAHAGAFKKLMSSEVQQLRQLLQAPQLGKTLHMLDGPIASMTAAQQTLTAGRAQSMQEALQVQVRQQQQLLTAVAADAIAAADNIAVPGLGPTSAELMKDYADAYASMKETMEVRLRHEQRRGDFLAGKVQQTEGMLRDTSAQLDAANRRTAEQRAEAAQLQEQVAQLQSDLAASHAAHLALQQHHADCMQAASQEKNMMQEQHKKIVETLQQELTAAGVAAAALAESSRQVEALRLLYNEELSRASRLAVELSRATAAADKAAAIEDAWQRQLKKSESKANNAEGLAGAMKVTVKQLEEQLALERAKLEEKTSHAAHLRLMLERSRLTAVERHAQAQAVVVGLAAKLETRQAQLSESQDTLSRTTDNLKLRMMELDGANVQLQAGRSHLKQLLSDLEAEQERTANLSSDLQKLRNDMDEATAQRDVADGRVKTLQGQISKANESNAAMHDKLVEVQSQFQAQTADFEQLQEAHEAEQDAHTALRTETTKVKARLAELSMVDQQLEQLQQAHAASEARLELVENDNVVLTAKARQLEFTTAQLQQLRQDEAALQARADALSQQLTAMTDSLTESQAAQQESAAQLLQLTDKFDKSEQDKAQLLRQLFDATSAGDGAQQQAASMSQQLEKVQQSLEVAEVDRQALVAQRDAWMASFQEAYGKLQEWTVSSEAAARRLATRASAIQGAMQQLSSQQAASHAAADRKSAVGLGLSLSGSGASKEAAVLAAADETAAAAMTASVLDQMAGLQQLMEAETNKHQETIDNTLKALQRRVSERHQAAEASWAEAMAVSNSKRAARAAARASSKQGLHALAAAGQHALQTSTAASENGGLGSPSVVAAGMQPSQIPEVESGPDGPGAVEDASCKSSTAGAVEADLGAAGLMQAELDSCGTQAESAAAEAAFAQQQDDPRCMAGAATKQQQGIIAAATPPVAGEPSANQNVDSITAVAVAASPAIATATQNTEASGPAMFQVQQSRPTPAPPRPAAASRAKQLQPQTQLQQHPPQLVEPEVQRQHAQQQLHWASTQLSPQLLQQLEQQQVQQKAYQQLFQQHQLLQQQHQVLLQHVQQQHLYRPVGGQAAAVQQGSSQQQSASALVQQAHHPEQQQQLLQQPSGVQAAMVRPSVSQLSSSAAAPVQQAQQQQNVLQQPLLPQQTQQPPPQKRPQQKQSKEHKSNSQQLMQPPLNCALHLPAAAWTAAAAADSEQQHHHQSGSCGGQPTDRVVAGTALTTKHAMAADSVSAADSHAHAAAAATYAAGEAAASQHLEAASMPSTDAGNCSKADGVAARTSSVLPAPGADALAVTVISTNVTVDPTVPAEVQVQSQVGQATVCPMVTSSPAMSSAAAAGDNVEDVPGQTIIRRASVQHVVTSTTTKVTMFTRSSSVESSSGPVEPGTGGLVSTRFERSSSSSSRAHSTEAMPLVSSSNTVPLGDNAAVLGQRSNRCEPQLSGSQAASDAVGASLLSAADYSTATSLPLGGLHLAGFGVSLSSRLSSESFSNFISAQTTTTTAAAAVGSRQVISQPLAPKMLNAAPGMANSTISISSQGDEVFMQSMPQNSASSASVPAMQMPSTALCFSSPAAMQGSEDGLHHQGFAPLLNISNPASVLGATSSASLDSLGSPDVGSAVGLLSGFVSLATYQEQMQSVAALHGQMGQLVVQLREAHADADGAQQQLQQERQEAAQRTGVLREALGQLHGQLDELRIDHEALQAAHRVLVAKDLMKSGLLKDRYVADLFARLQEAEWKLSIARERACAWGFNMLVPLGRVDRGIQTQYAEVWAASQQQDGATSLQVKHLQLGSKQHWLLEGSTSPGRPLNGGGSRHQLLDPLPLGDPGAGMSCTTSSTAAVAALSSPTPAAARTAVEREQAAFAHHGPNNSSAGSKNKGTGCTSQARPHSAKSATSTVGDAAAAVTSPAALSAALLSAAEQVLALGTVQMLSEPALLQLMASLYSAKAAVDAAALRSHMPAQGLWEFVLKQLQRQHSSKGFGLPIVVDSGKASGTTAANGSSSGKHRGSSKSGGGGGGAAAALAQLLGSVQQHGNSNKAVAQFAAALSASKAEYHERLSQEQQDSSSKQAATSHSSDLSNISSTRDNAVIKGTWGEVRLDSGKLAPALTDPALVLLPPCAVGLVQRMLGWPGMLPLLRWIAGGHFLWCLRDGDLGRVLMDVQAPHVHFLLLEAADILGLHPLPQVHMVQAAAPFVHMLRVPTAKLAPSAAGASSRSNKDSSYSSAQQQQETETFSKQRQVLLVMSSAALQLLQPAELQATMAAALVPAVLSSCQPSDSMGFAMSASRSSEAAAARQVAEPAGGTADVLETVPGHPELADLATLSSLLALQPSMLLSHLPPEMHAMGGSLAAALQAVQRLVAAAGDRGSLLVAQDLAVAVNAVVRTSMGTSASLAAGDTSSCARDGLMQQWLQRVQDKQNDIPALQQLLPSHGMFASAADGASNNEKNGFAATTSMYGCELAIEEDHVLLMRVRDLIAWAGSEQYQALMAAARPLRRVLPRTRLPSA